MNARRILGEKIYCDRATVLGQLGVFREPTSIAGRLLVAINHPFTIAGAFGRRLRGTEEAYARSSLPFPACFS
jgi:hypothetical protein